MSEKSVIPEFIDPELLPDNHHVATKEMVRIDYSPEQVADMKDRHFQISLHKSNRDSLVENIKELVSGDIPREEIIAGIKEIVVGEVGDQGIKALKDEFKKSIKVINQGYIVEETTLYGFVHQDIRRMAFYLPDGRFHHDRPMKTSEMQLSTMPTPVVPMEKTA